MAEQAEPSSRGAWRLCRHSRWLLGSTQVGLQHLFSDANGGLARITPRQTSAFYHEVERDDFNGDGLKDILTARVNKRDFTPGNYDEGERPGESCGCGWKTHVTTTGPDMIFQSVPYKDGLAIFCTEFL